MVTKIKSTNTGQLGRITGRRVAARGKAGGSGKSRDSGRQDDVAISTISRTIGAAGEAITQAPDVRVELVEPIREALAGGRYNISSLDVADKILRQVLQDRKSRM
ncbi:MAG: flagellar biosynthesis anti-sigma factor FlgM [Magnetococcales bacterium]|nr:flagellar biosynthesis anti-sigma factor FlgM [Magnetococcales bacterium]